MRRTRDRDTRSTAVPVWELVPCLFKPNGTATTSIALLLQQCRKMISLPPIGLGSTPLYSWILWVLWTNRNKLLFENRRFSEQDTVLKAIQDARALRAAHTNVSKPSLPQCVVQQTCVPTRRGRLGTRWRSDRVFRIFGFSGLRS